MQESPSEYKCEKSSRLDAPADIIVADEDQDGSRHSVSSVSGLSRRVTMVQEFFTGVRVHFTRTSMSTIARTSMSTVAESCDENGN